MCFCLCVCVRAGIISTSSLHFTKNKKDIEMNSVRTGREETILYHVCREYPKKSKGKLIEIMREFNKIIGFKINM